MIASFAIMISMIANLATAASHALPAALMMQVRSTNNGTKHFDIAAAWEKATPLTQFAIAILGLPVAMILGVIVVYVTIGLAMALICIYFPV